ncbi:hypothetical protein C8R48DRAFT_715079 [Suillus tomentosus]|nr:hypothetical protein C8R48DRAFT_715079 [Suillus tomentosus]
MLGRLQAVTALVSVFTLPDVVNLHPEDGPVTTPPMQPQALRHLPCLSTYQNGKFIRMVFSDTTICPDPRLNTSFWSRRQRCRNTFTLDDV